LQVWKYIYHYNTMKNLILILFCGTIFLQSNAQNSRINTSNNIGWYNYFGTLKLNNKLGIHHEYQWRRAQYLSTWQQSLLRVGLNYQINPRVLCRVGYAWAETFAYGDIPLNSLGRAFTEHRAYEMLQLAQKEGRVDISHRFMLEQRFVGKYSSANVSKEDEFPLLHRMRYLCRWQMPLKGKQIANKTPYLGMYDEVFIGFGKNVNANVFDQNRLALFLGYKFNSKFRTELVYLNQTLQYGRQINVQSVFQNNNGFTINLYCNF
jgi:hypothetical protein